jgi:hypothetical protein
VLTSGARWRSPWRGDWPVLVVGAVQGVRLHRCHRPGASLVELRCGDGLLLLVLLLFLLFSSSSSAIAAPAKGEKQGRLGFQERPGFLYEALGFGEWLR